MKYTTRLVLVMSMSSPDAENRLKTQIIGLQKMNFEIHTLGLGKIKVNGVEKHFQIKDSKRGPLSSILRLFVHLTRQPKDRFEALTLSRVPIRELTSNSYDLIINHDLELLPLITQEKFIPDSFRSAAIQVDLHEHHSFSGEETGPLSSIWRIFGKRLPAYHDWLLAQLSSTAVHLTTVVNRSIGDWYVSKGFLPWYVEIKNAAPSSNLPLSPRTEEPLKFIHHGKYSKRRGLEDLVQASLEFTAGDTLHFMLTGSRKEILKFRNWAERINASISFHSPVPMAEVAEALSDFDAELLYFEPTSKNKLFALPNKLFEAVQGNLAIICGPSPELIRHVDEFGFGKYSAAWGVKEFATLVRDLDRDTVEIFRSNSHKAALTLNADLEAEKLILEWKKLLTLTG